MSCYPNFYVIHRAFIIHSDSWGVYLRGSGPYFPKGYWSMIPSCKGINLCPAYSSMEEAMKVIAEWPFLAVVPSDIRYIEADAFKLGNGEFRVNRLAARMAGVRTW